MCLDVDELQLNEKKNANVDQNEMETSNQNNNKKKHLQKIPARRQASGFMLVCWRSMLWWQNVKEHRGKDAKKWKEGKRHKVVCASLFLLFRIEVDGNNG